MLGLYTPLLALQAFCIYHAYRNNAEQRWYWLILFFPLVGCIIYLYHNFYNRNTVSTLAQGVKEVVNTNYRIEQLEKNLRFADNITNKTNLADAYVQHGRYADALLLYKDCLSGFMADDPTLRMKALHAGFLAKDYDVAIAYGNELNSEKSFKNAEAKISYAWSLYYAGDVERAGVVFQEMNKPNTNYIHRLEYCKFLQLTKNTSELSEVLSELNQEFDHMKGTERKVHRNVMREVREFRA